MNPLQNTFVSIIIITGIHFCSCSAQRHIDIGDIWPDTSNVHKKIFLMPPYNFQNRIDFSINNINFTGAIDADNIVIYLSTTNPNFKINGVQYIGRTLSSFENKNELKVIKGWGNYLPIADKWYAYFGWKDFTDSSKVSLVFKLK